MPAECMAQTWRTRADPTFQARTDCIELVRAKCKSFSARGAARTLLHFQRMTRLVPARSGSEHVQDDVGRLHRAVSAGLIGYHDAEYRVDLKQVGRKAAAIAEREAIMDMLVRTLGNKKECAQRLGISYRALHYKIRDLGIANWRPSMSRTRVTEDERVPGRIPWPG